MSGSVLRELAAPLGAAVEAVGGEPDGIRLDRPADPAHGDFGSPVALSLARSLGRSPRDIAAAIGGELSSEWVSEAEIAGPGFINLRLAPAWYGHVVGRILHDGAEFGAGAAADPQRIQVEFVSGNPTGPVTVGSAR